MDASGKFFIRSEREWPHETEYMSLQLEDKPRRMVKVRGSLLRFQNYDLHFQWNDEFYVSKTINIVLCIKCFCLDWFCFDHLFRQSKTRTTLFCMISVSNSELTNIQYMAQLNAYWFGYLEFDKFWKWTGYIFVV